MTCSTWCTRMERWNQSRMRCTGPSVAERSKAGSGGSPSLIAVTASPSVVQGSSGGSEVLSDVKDRPPQLRMPILPFKLNQDRRHHIARQRRKVTNWPAYDASCF